MIISPVVGATRPTAGKETPGESFAEAIAAAMGGNNTARPEVQSEGEAAVDTAIPAPTPHTAVADQIAQLMVTAGGQSSRLETGEAGEDLEAPLIGALPSADPGAPEATVITQPPLTGVTEHASSPAAEGPRPHTTNAEPPDQPEAPAAGTLPVNAMPGRAGAAEDPIDGDPAAGASDPDIEPSSEAAAPVTSETASTEGPWGPADPSVPERATHGDAPSTPTAAPGGAEAVARNAAREPVDATIRAATIRDTTIRDATIEDATAPSEAPETGAPHAKSATTAVDPMADGPGESPTTESIQTPTQSTRADRGEPVPAGTLRRVENAIRHLENAPPPKTITITVDDQGLHRVTVSLHADGVKLSIPDGAATDSRLIADLEHSLESRGFDLSGRERDRRERRDEADSFVPTAAPADSPARSNDGIRI